MPATPWAMFHVKRVRREMIGRAAEGGDIALGGSRPDMERGRIGETVVLSIVVAMSSAACHRCTDVAAWPRRVFHVKRDTRHRS